MIMVRREMADYRRQIFEVVSSGNRRRTPRPFPVLQTTALRLRDLRFVIDDGTPENAATPIP